MSKYSREDLLNGFEWFYDGPTKQEIKPKQIVEYTTTKLLVPEKAYNIIEKSTYKKKHHLYLILNLIYKQFNKFNDNRTAFAEISTKKFNEVISSKRDSYSAKKWLIDNDIIVVDEVSKYKVGKYSKGYYFSNKVLSDPIVYEYQVKVKQKKEPIIKDHFSVMKDYFINNFFLDTDKVLQEINKDFPVVNGKRHNVKLFNKYFRWLNEIQFSYIYNNLNISLFPQFFSKSAIIVPSNNLLDIIKKPLLFPQNSIPVKTKKKTRSYLKETKDNSMLYQNYLTQVDRSFRSKTNNINLIKAHDLSFNRNPTNNRIDSNLTILKSDYKKYILSNKELTQIDISNSQPYLFSLLLKDNTNLVSKPDVDLFIQLCEQGDIYDYYSTLINKDRKYVKKLFFKILYSQTESYKKEKDIFRKTFPNIMNYIDNSNISNHNEISIKLQRLESEMIIDTICPRLINKGVIAFTIHDSFIIEYDKVNDSLDIIEECFKNKYNSIPKLKIEKVN